MRTRLLTAACAALLAIPALADTKAGGSGQGQFLNNMPEGGIRASKLIGTDVVGLDINRIGDIDDIIVDRQGQVVTAVVGAGGFLGMGDKRVAIPFGELLINFDVSPTQGASSSNTGAIDNKGNMQMQSAVATPVGPTPPTTTGTVGDPAKPREGLDVGKVATPVTGDGAPRRVMIRMTRDDLRNAPEFKLGN